jgi:serine/threonine protein phosphatase PrpC
LINLGQISWLSYSIPKAGNRDVENEDALFPESGSDENSNGKPITFLVADGATQTSFSGLWARCLIEACVKNRLTETGFQRSIENAREKWQKSFEGKEIPWHAAEKIRQGAFAALIWLEVQYLPLQPANAYSWKALAIGDCCLFIARKQSIYLSLPLQNVTDFSLHPTLIPSKLEQLHSIKGKIQTAKGSLKKGDQIILASDAIAAWILKQSQSDRLTFLEMVQSIKNAKNGDGFTKWVNSLRKTGEIKNDDTSVIYIELGEKSNALR